MTEGYYVTRSSRAARIAALLGTVAVVVLVAAPWWAGRADMRLMSELFLYLALASLWNLLAGYAGLVSVGQQAFVGFGGYALFALAMFLGIHPVLALPLVAVICQGFGQSHDIRGHIFMLVGEKFPGSPHSHLNLVVDEE